jgi:peptide/nickel transport system substrate-binding protein
MKNLKFLMCFMLGVVFTVTMLVDVRAAFPASPIDTLTVAMGSLAEETFLPWNGNPARGSYLTPIFDYLVYAEPETGKVLPGLATRWEMSADGKTWTFWLREGVQFHEGWGEFTADDVVYTMQRAAGPESRSATGVQLRGYMNTVEAPERYKVVFHLKVPLADLPTASLSNVWQIGIICKKYVENVGDEKANSHPIGTGPYTLVQFKRGTSIGLQTIADAEKHWRIKPQFKNINFLIVPEESTRVAMLKTGEVDLAPISYDSIETIKAAGLNIISIPNNWAPAVKWGGLVMTDPKLYKPNNPWADRRVRQALNYAVDKEAIVKTIFHGQAKPAGATQILPEWIEIKPYPYDPAKAKQLLADAGYAKGFPITLKTFVTSPGAELPTIAQAVAMYWQAIGVDVKIVPIDWGTVRAEWMGGKTLDYVWTHRGMPFTSSPSGVNVELTTQVYPMFVTEKTVAMASAITRELDLKKRSALVREMGEYVRDEGSAVFLVFASDPYGASKKVGKWPTISGYVVNMEYITRP